MSSAYVAATDLDTALRALRDAGPLARPLAGGTDLLVEWQSGRSRPGTIVDLWRVRELREIRPQADGSLRLGALATCHALRDARVAQRAPSLAAAAAQVGGEQIQNRATLGGNLGTASPAADLVPVLFALDARVVLRSCRGARELPVAGFVTGYRLNARAPDELIEAVVLPPAEPATRVAFRKVGTRRAQSISKVVVAVAVACEGRRVTAVRAAAGAVADRTIVLPALARELVGHEPEPGRIAAAARAAAREDARPIDDIRSTAAWRREVLFRVLRTMLHELLET